MQSSKDTICAIATAPGRGGVGIVRISGSQAKHIGEQCTKLKLKPRHAHFTDFYQQDGGITDQGIALYFHGPNSFTGEDVFEFQGHGGPIILDQILQRCVELGARLARPGEFSERAFLNDKMDLTQAEATADLIDANSKQAAQQALQSLRGAFAEEINKLLDLLTHLRLYVESAIDFPEEEIDFLGDGIVADKLSHIITQTNTVFKKAQQGTVLREGMHVVLAGKPNAGKSTLLNALAERDVAIVTDIEGTTRDALTEHIHIDGMPLHITDTAGLRATDNEVEQIGIQRAWQAIDKADRILLLVDAKDYNADQLAKSWPEFFDKPGISAKLTVVINKIDLEPNVDINQKTQPTLRISAREALGVDELKAHLLEVMGINNTTEGSFSARRRHLDALERCLSFLHAGEAQLSGFAAGELLAEDLRLAQECLGEITGKFSPDDLLGKIFSSFCIGK